MVLACHVILEEHVIREPLHIIIIFLEVFLGLKISTQKKIQACLTDSLNGNVKPFPGSLALVTKAPR